MEDHYLSPWTDNSDEPILSIDALVGIQLGMTTPEGFFVSSSLAISFSRRH